MRPVVRSFASVHAFVSKEITELVRSPAALVSLTVGPVLIMVRSGWASRDTRRRFAP